MAEPTKGAPAGALAPRSGDRPFSAATAGNRSAQRDRLTPFPRITAEQQAEYTRILGHAPRNGFDRIAAILLLTLEQYQRDDPDGFAKEFLVKAKRRKRAARGKRA